MNSKQKYDLVCSLGANCSASNALKFRKLRNVALPFDWTWFDSEEALLSLAQGFKCKFANFMNKENLRKLTPDEYSNSHSDRIQYEDINTKFRYYNHFNVTSNESLEIDRVIKIFRRRCDRFDFLLKNSKNVLLILSCSSDLPLDSVRYLFDVIKAQYQNCAFKLIFQAFDCNEEIKKEIDDITILKHKRKENFYDYTMTNYEWSFLDEVVLSENFYNNCEKFTQSKSKLSFLIDVRKIKKGIHVVVLPNVSTIMYAKVYLFGLRFHITIGKVKVE
jgi:hypothetical protein